VSEQYCQICDQWVPGIGPWCRLYLENQFCPPLIRLRRRIYAADSEGDGPLVNALCAEIRRVIGDEYVP
jgi:hypothetical protein